MTDVQRDELLITLAKGINNLKEEITELRKELKQEIKESEERTKSELMYLSSEI